MQIPRLTPCPMFCALKRRLLDHPEISSNRHAALPDPNVRDRAGGAVVVTDVPVEATATGWRVGFVGDPPGSLPSRFGFIGRQPGWVPLAQERLRVWSGWMSSAVPRTQGWA